MITAEAAQDILAADQARRDAGKLPLLTTDGLRVFRNLVTIMRPIPQSEVDAIVRESLHRPQPELQLP